MKRIKLPRRDETTRTNAGWGDLPPEMLENVLRHVVTDDPVKTSREVANLRLINRATKAYVDGHELFKRLHLPSQVIKLAGDIYKKVYPRNGLTETMVGLDDRTRLENSLPVTPARYISATGPVISVLPKEKGEAVIDDIRRMVDQDGRADVIRALARHTKVDTLSNRDQKFVIDEAIRGFISAGPPDSFRRTASAEALAHVYNHIPSAQRDELRQGMSGRPQLGLLLESKRAEKQQRDLGESNLSASDTTSKGVSRGEMKTLRARFDNIPRIGKIRRIVQPLRTEYRKVEQVSRIAEDFSAAVRKDCDGFHTARAALERRYDMRLRSTGRSR